MLIEIVKDSATAIVKECTEDQAAVYAQTFVVNVIGEDGEKTPYGAAPAEEVAEPVAAKKAKKK